MSSKNMKIGYVGLGKMGKNMVLRLKEQGVNVIAYNRSDDELKNANSIKDLVNQLESPSVIWLMLPPGEVTQSHIDQLENLCEEGDIIIDGSNNHFSNAKKHADQLSSKGIKFVDVGVSGGPEGALNGACLMIGGDEKTYTQLIDLFKVIAAPEAYQFFPGFGAGHYVKMVHNGIEYGMMQAIAEGFNLMKQSDFNLNLVDVARIYNRRSVVESRLIGWLYDQYKENGVDLDNYGGTVGHLGEGQWTVEHAKKKNIPLKVIEDSLKFRVESKEKPSYTGKILQSLRTAFGGKRTNKDKPYK